MDILHKITMAITLILFLVAALAGVFVLIIIWSNKKHGITKKSVAGVRTTLEKKRTLWVFAPGLILLSISVVIKLLEIHH